MTAIAEHKDIRVWDFIHLSGNLAEDILFLYFLLNKLQNNMEEDVTYHSKITIPVLL